MNQDMWESALLTIPLRATVFFIIIYRYRDNQDEEMKDLALIGGTEKWIVKEFL